MKKKINPVLHYAVCINNEGYKASLEKGKLYRTLPDEKAASHGYMRVIDESGEDYGYSATRFIPIKLPRVVEKALFTGGDNVLPLALSKPPRRVRIKENQKLAA